MSAIVLGTAEVTRLDVVGRRRGDSGIVDHVGLAAEDLQLDAGGLVRTYHMGPPLGIEPPAQFQATVHGSLSLSRDEQEGIDEWLAEIAPLASQCSYVALPAARIRRDEDSEQIIGWDFSCAGFVAAAYQAGADITLIEQDELPLLDMATAHRIWGGGLPLAVFKRIAPRIGLTGAGPWPVLVPSHILHALAKDRAGLPYQPAMDDIAFP